MICDEQICAFLQLQGNHHGSSLKNQVRTSTTQFGWLDGTSIFRGLVHPPELMLVYVPDSWPLCFVTVPHRPRVPHPNHHVARQGQRVHSRGARDEGAAEAPRSVRAAQGGETNRAGTREARWVRRERTRVFRCGWGIGSVEGESLEGYGRAGLVPRKTSHPGAVVQLWPLLGALGKASGLMRIHMVSGTHSVFVRCRAEGSRPTCRTDWDSLAVEEFNTWRKYPNMWELRSSTHRAL